MQKTEPNKDRSGMSAYAGLGMGLLVSVGLSVFIGLKADRWLRMPFPVLTWLLPLLVIVALIIKLIRETSRHRDGK
jgi:lipopolysaccharide export LptBFGC system permease protein LptF